VSGLRPFALHRAESVEECSRLLAERGPEAMLYAGGTELLVLLKAGFVRPRWLIDVKRVPGLGGIDANAGDVAIGATATHREVERSAAVRARCPLVAGVARHVANVRVRAVGTVGGNLAFADPHSDLATLCLIFDARVALRSGAASRELPLAEFVRGPYETARRDDELLTAVRLSPWPAGAAGAYVKFGVHERPTLAVAVALLPGEARVALGCVGPRPERVARVEAALRGATAGEVARRAPELGALAAEGVDAVDDLHGSAEYKRDMTRVFVGRALALAAARLEGREPDVRYAHAVAV
jgi:aerobic carbon-monoxide dehydrogenase medium subunit